MLENRVCSQFITHLGTHLLHHGVLHGLQIEICSMINLCGGRRTIYLTLVFTTGCRGISATGAWSTSSSFFIDLGVCRVVSLTNPHSSLQLSSKHFFNPILKHVIPEALPLSLTSSLAISRPSSEPASIESLSDGRSV